MTATRSTDAKSDSTWSIVVWVALVVAMLPALPAWVLFAPLDASLFAVAAALGMAVVHPLLVWRRRRGPRTRRLHPAAQFAPWVAAPFWGIGVIVSANVILDAGPRARHPTEFVELRKCTKHRSCAVFRSWRSAGGEESVRLEGVRAFEPSLYGLPPGSPVVVVTAPGALGWEHIVGVERR